MKMRLLILGLVAMIAALWLVLEAGAQQALISTSSPDAAPAQEVSAASVPAADALEAEQAPASSSAEAQQALVEADTIAGGMDGFISLDLRDIDIIEALKFLSRKADLDIVATKAVAGRVTLMVENVLVKDVFDIMLRSNKLAYDRRGMIYSVMAADEYKQLYGEPFADTREVATFRLKYAIPEQAFSLFDAMKSDIGRVLVDPESGSVLVIDIPDKVREMAAVLEAFEQKSVVKIFPLQYARAKEVEDQLKNQLDAKKVGFIKADERLNQVIVQTLPERMEQISQIIVELDAKTKEVVIDVNIIQVKISDQLDQGFQWEGLFDMGREKGLAYIGSTPFAVVNPVTTAGNFTSREEQFKNENNNVGSYPASSTTSSVASSTPKVGTESLHVGMVTAQDFDTVITYINTLGSTKILSNPKLVVTNNQESRIHVGEKQAYVTTTTTTGQVTSTVAENVTFVDVGTQLAVTPTINDDGFITMKVKAEISAVVDTLVTPTKNEIPIINSSLAETTVMVKDGTTVIIGGLKDEIKVKGTTKTPYLGDVPLLGWLFKASKERLQKTDLLIMLTPRIVSGEIFVTEAGKTVEEPAIKDIQDYQSLNPMPAPVNLDVDPIDRKSTFKGLRTVN